MNYKMLLQNTLSQEATLMVNKKILIKYGWDIAIFIAYLIDQERYHGEYFYCTDNDIHLFTAITMGRITKVKKFCKKEGLIDYNVEGKPQKTYYTLDHKKILSVIASEDGNSSLAYERVLGTEKKPTKEEVLGMSKKVLIFHLKKNDIGYSGSDLKDQLVKKLLEGLNLVEVVETVVPLENTGEDTLPKKTVTVQTEEKQEVVTTPKKPLPKKSVTVTKKIGTNVETNNLLNKKIKTSTYTEKLDTVKDILMVNGFTRTDIKEGFVDDKDIINTIHRCYKHDKIKLHAILKQARTIPLVEKGKKVNWTRIKGYIVNQINSNEPEVTTGTGKDYDKIIAGIYRHWCNYIPSCKAEEILQKFENDMGSDYPRDIIEKYRNMLQDKLSI